MSSALACEFYVWIVEEMIPPCGTPVLKEYFFRVILSVIYLISSDIFGMLSIHGFIMHYLNDDDILNVLKAWEKSIAMSAE